MLLNAIEDQSLDFASIHDALSEIGLPVSLYYDDLRERDASSLRKWWTENRDRTKDARSTHRIGGGLPPLDLFTMTDNHVMHTKDRMARIQMETTLAVLGDDRRSL